MPITTGRLIATIILVLDCFTENLRTSRTAIVVTTGFTSRANFVQVVTNLVMVHKVTVTVEELQRFF